MSPRPALQAGLLFSIDAPDAALFKDATRRTALERRSYRQGE